MVTVSYSKLSEAFDFASFGGGGEVAAYISLDTGAIYLVSEFVESEFVEEELPDDLETSDRYLLLPDKSELGLGHALALEFTQESVPDFLGKVEDIFRRKGAYGRFKDLLESHHILERWYQFETESTKEALLRWCAENDIQVVEGEP
jgi:hypothetical protein